MDEDLGTVHLYPPAPDDEAVPIDFNSKSTTCTIALGIPLAAVKFHMEPDVVYNLTVTGPELVTIDGKPVTAITIHTNDWKSRPSQHRVPKDDQANAGSGPTKAVSRTATAGEKPPTKETGGESDPSGAETP